MWSSPTCFYLQDKDVETGEMLSKYTSWVNTFAVQCLDLTYPNQGSVGNARLFKLGRKIA